MNSIVTIGCIVVLAATASANQAYMEEVIEKVKDCGVKQGLTDAELESYMKMEDGDVQKFGCAKACFLKEYNLIADGGGINVDAAHEMIEKIFDDNADAIPKLKELVANCASGVNDIADECAMALEFTKCYHSQADEPKLNDADP